MGAEIGLVEDPVTQPTHAQKPFAADVRADLLLRQQGDWPFGD
jgi:hypothetical protein